MRFLWFCPRQDADRPGTLRRYRCVFPSLAILYRRGIRYLTLQGGEPLVHPGVVQLVSQTVATGISCAIITNGWFLSRYIKSLAAAGLCQLIVSLDSADLAEHERNRGLDGLERRLAEGIAQAREYGLPVQASVTVNRLVGYDALVPCIGGYKYFYLDWNLDIWRCEAWSEPMGSVFDLDRIPDQREPCNACMMACYRNASMLMHAAVAVTDAGHALAS